MTSDVGGLERSGLGPLGRRLLVAFLLVALSSVLALTLAALIGTDRGLTASREADRARAAAQTAAAAAVAYQRAGGWTGIDLGPAQALASGAGARLIVLDRAGDLVRTPSGATPPPGSEMPGMRHGMDGGQGITTASVVAGGTVVGSVQLRFGTPAAEGARDVAWGWIGGAALGALGIALAVSLVVTRRLTGPIAAVTRAARAFAAGDRTIRTEVTAPGELGELAGAFDDMADQVTRAELSRRRLAADVAHELRTPLTTLQAGLEELRDGLSEADPAHLAALHDQALRLSRIVGDLAELSAAESAALSLHIRPVDLADLAGTVLKAIEPRLRASELSVHADLREGVIVNADPDRLHQAIGNLLDNAARYCRPHDAVTVGVRAAGGEAIVEVTDTGPGIPAEDLPHVFDRLWRGRSSRGVAGSGIGLAVVRELVSAHHGSVTAAPGPHGGVTFTIRLPCGTPATGHRKTTSGLHTTTDPPV